jgi:hypothetical protein
MEESQSDIYSNETAKSARELGTLAPVMPGLASPPKFTSKPRSPHQPQSLTETCPGKFHVIRKVHVLYAFGNGQIQFACQYGLAPP